MRPGRRRRGLLSAAAWLPNGFRELEYIESTGEQYISAGLSGTEKTRILIDAAVTISSEVAHLCGNLADTTKSISFNMSSLSSAISRFGDQKTSGLAYNYVVSDMRSLFDLSNDGYCINGVNCWTPNASAFTTTGNLRLFTTAANSNKLIAKMYRAKIFEDGVLVRDFVPCLRQSDDEVGLYDIVTHTFYTNAGSGSFIGGAQI